LKLYHKITGTCFIQKIYAPSSSLLQGKHLLFSLISLRLGFRRNFLSVLHPNRKFLRNPNLNEITLFPFPTSPQYFSLICDPFADPIISLHSRDISFFNCHIQIYLPGPSQTNWTRIVSECGLLKISVIETDTLYSHFRFVLDFSYAFGIL
jgi:hypothetical protein